MVEGAAACSALPLQSACTPATSLNSRQSTPGPTPSFINNWGFEMNQRNFWTKTILAAAAGLCVLGFAGHSLAAQPGIRCVQNQLNTLGFDAGRADGSIGPMTRQAAEQYRTWMAGGAGGAGWSFPALTAINGQMWCEGVAKDHPELAKFVTPISEPTQYTSSGAGGLVAIFDVPVEGRITDWEFHFTYKTECENDHFVSLTSLAGRTMGLMDRGLGRCSRNADQLLERPGRSRTVQGNARQWQVAARLQGSRRQLPLGRPAKGADEALHHQWRRRHRARRRPRRPPPPNPQPELKSSVYH